ncbi:MAG TPA: PepSY domain-containing protein [Gaiellaceae bacterium]|nr:PepSY domain-containing protein [Gaiellaceae bacterium]
MSKTHRYLMLVVAVLGLIAFSAGIAVAAGSGGETTTPAAVSDEAPADDNEASETEDDGNEGQDEGDASLTGASADKAAEAALATTGGGTVLAVESDDGGAGYEVEIRKSDGSEVDVELDESFATTQRSEDD